MLEQIAVIFMGSSVLFQEDVKSMSGVRASLGSRVRASHSDLFGSISSLLLIVGRLFRVVLLFDIVLQILLLDDASAA